MAVHLPLTAKAQEEAKNIMASNNNLLKPATGKPIVNPEKDMVFGVYYMTMVNPSAKGSGRIFSDKREAVLAYDFGQIDIQALIKVSKGKNSKIGYFSIKIKVCHNLPILPFPSKNGCINSIS